MILSIVLFSPGAAGSSSAPTTDSSDDARRPRPDDLRVMSVNIRYGTAPDGENVWPKRRELLFNSIKTFDPDLLGAQEVLDFQLDELQKAMPGHRFIGVGRDDGRSGGEFSPLAYRADRFEEVAHGHFWLSETPEKPGSKSWDSHFPRLTTWVKLSDRRDPKRAPVLFLNTHWDYAGTRARENSAALMRDRIKQISEDSAVIVTGDFNCTEDDEPYSVLIGVGDDSLQLTDSYRAIHPDRQTDEATFHGFQGTEAGSRIDFILHDPHLRSVDAGIDRTHQRNRYPSDHYPITAVLRRADPADHREPASPRTSAPAPKAKPSSP
jgi:endonuclease/exonuclease/phosphatase family metal-dependent hydrolase